MRMGNLRCNGECRPWCGEVGVGTYFVVVVVYPIPPHPTWNPPQKTLAQTYNCWSIIWKFIPHVSIFVQRIMTLTFLHVHPVMLISKSRSPGTSQIQSGLGKRENVKWCQWCADLDLTYFGMMCWLRFYGFGWMGGGGSRRWVLK